MRLDVYLVEKNICSSREKAKELILNGFVDVNSIVVTKPSFLVSEADSIGYSSSGIIPYVSRGGLKLERAIQTFGLDFRDKKVLDIGSSTGGFTDCAIKHGADFVWAVDVGSNQLDESLKKDKRVCSIENTDFRNLKPEQIGGKVDVVVADLSFISLKHILKYIPEFLTPEGFAVLLIKPQFEAGPQKVGKGGIVKDQKVHIEVIGSVVDYSRSTGLYLSELTWSPIVDAKKNIEYLALFQRSFSKQINIKESVERAFSILKKLH